MMKQNPNPNPNSSSASVEVLSDQITFLHTDSSSGSVQVANAIQFFVRMISDGKTLVFRGKPDDTVKSIHEKIQSVTGIPLDVQRLIYGGKQLQWQHSLSECLITNDSGLHLVGRMRSTMYRRAWQVVNDLVSTIFKFCRNDAVFCLDVVKRMLMEFLSMAREGNTVLAVDHLNIFMFSSLPKALVMLYLSPIKGNKEGAEKVIQFFLTSNSSSSKNSIFSQSLPIVVQFCKLLLIAAPYDDPLHKLCATSLGLIMKQSKNFSAYNHNLQQCFPLVSVLSIKLSVGLSSSVKSVNNLGPSRNDVRVFTSFLRPLKIAIKGYGDFLVPILHYQDSKTDFLYRIFHWLLMKLVFCLGLMEETKKNGDGDWDQFLALLKELHDVSKLYQGVEEYFWTKLRRNKASLCYLIVRYAKRGEDYEWILDRKDITDFESRRHLVTLLLPEVDEEHLSYYEMLIDRSQLLAESFEYIAYVEPDALRDGILMEFENEEATGPGVLREWFFLVCQEIFNTKNALFLACPSDRRRFFPNPVSKVNSLHHEYFNFSGRVIALALAHKVQVGIVFDRSFFLQLAGKNVSLEDIKDADPYLYSSCKQILDMDPLIVDQDVLGLTFIWETEELGSIEAIELCPGGNDIIVNSKNRREYVDLIIQHRFVTSIGDQVTHFAQGFSDIASEEKIRKLYFKSLELEDFDGILYGSENAISVQDWKAHTKYKDFREADPEICWFWKIIEEMTAEQRKILLFFWTSIKYLPLEGFRGLPWKLEIYNSHESLDRLPSAQTCFFRIYLPIYPSMAIMKQRFNVITQEHVGSSFGKW